MIWISVIFTIEENKTVMKKTHLCGIYYFTDLSNTSGEYKFDANNFVFWQLTLYN